MLDKRVLCVTFVQLMLALLAHFAHVDAGPALSSFLVTITRAIVPYVLTAEALVAVILNELFVTAHAEFSIRRSLVVTRVDGFLIAVVFVALTEFFLLTTVE